MNCLPSGEVQEKRVNTGLPPHWVLLVSEVSGKLEIKSLESLFHLFPQTVNSLDKCINFMGVFINDIVEHMGGGLCMYVYVCVHVCRYMYWVGL